ncbi:MAG: hypothetical protein WAO61_00140, partial [Solirubrobacterales bacterium]
MRFDGPLPTRQRMTGPVTATTTQSYDDDFRLATATAVGEIVPNPVEFQFHRSSSDIQTAASVSAVASVAVTGTVAAMTAC